jgi:hypothetical protein
VIAGAAIDCSISSAREEDLGGASRVACVAFDVAEIVERVGEPESVVV